jgi:hypothetical protein
LRDQDDVVAGFSSLGPTRGDYLAKPDLVAPGRGILSLAVPGSTLYQNNADYLVSATSKPGSPRISVSVARAWPPRRCPALWR